MMRISALNEETDSNSSIESEVTTVTKEAEETIAISEYMRALSLKQNGKTDDALFLFSELLDTQVLTEVTKDLKENKLFSVKYNCYRHIGFIYEEQGKEENALKSLLEAIELDETDVYTMCRVAKLALKMKQIQIAKSCFETCLKRNPNHWPSLDGLLQVFCMAENIIETYGWAMHCFKKDRHYKRAIDVLMEISERFASSIPFLEELWNCRFELDEITKNNWKKPEKSCFPEASYYEMKSVRPEVNFDPFKVEKFTWQSLGNLIINLHDYIRSLNDEYYFVFTLEQFTLKKEDEIKVKEEETVCEIVENKPEEKQDADVEILSEEDDVIMINDDGDETNISSDGNKKDLKSDTDAETSKLDESLVHPQVQESKSKSRRRGSELKILEQWGWHKNRRSTRKKSMDPGDSIDTSMCGFLKRCLPNYFIDNFETTSSPFSEEKKVVEEQNTEDATKAKEKAEKVELTLEEFDKFSKESFDSLIKELKEREFDFVIIIFKYLHYLSQYWDHYFPPELREIYLKVFNLFKLTNDFNAWNQLPDDEIQSSFRMTLFYLELQHDALEIKAKNSAKIEIDPDFRRILNYLKFYLCFLNDDTIFPTMISKIFWLIYCIEKYENNFINALDHLYKIEDLIVIDKHEIKVNLPNQQFNNFYDLATLKELVTKLERRISLSNVKKLYEEENFEDLVGILKDSLINCTETKTTENLTLNVQTQIEILLEAFWNLEKFEDCLIWSEKSLKYTTDFFMTLAPDSYRLKEWGKNINFILVYIEALIAKEGSDILLVLEKNLSRMIQSLQKILSHQLDAPIDKHNSQPHSISTRIPWAILYYILQREDDKNIGMKKLKDVSLNSTSISEYEEETLSNSILMFFTAHELLGRRQWCSKDDSKLLLLALDVVVPKLRSPLLEPFRDLLNEYLEQTTYCLYGYPPKRARARHIEEHDAVPAHLTWDRAIQLFDLYRPDNLPEFNSYKLDSITADMEALLQRILLLMPEEFDVSTHTSSISKFIDGNENDIPQEIDLLPFKIKSIYYLLADFYFKSRDFSKAIKYYVIDLALKPTRFDSWAGIALSKASKNETKLNSTEIVNPKDFLEEADNAIKCFNQSLKLNDGDSQLWIEYGSFAYNIQSFCSRSLKLLSDTLSMESFAFVESKKDKCLNIASSCFNKVNVANMAAEKSAEAEEKEKKEKNDEEEEDVHEDEKWLHHYMLGKIAEKRKESPEVYLEHYQKSAKYLYESNATYPIKINHNNPSNLSVEALEIYYRINAAIIKYLEQRSPVNRKTAKLFSKTLKDLSSSPFAINRAKPANDHMNAHKRKLAAAASTEIPEKQQKVDENTPVKLPEPIISEVKEPEKVVSVEENTAIPRVEELKNENIGSPSRRGSQESTATNTTTTTSTSNGTSSSSSSSDSSSTDDSSSSDTDSESSTEDEEKNDAPISEKQLTSLFKICIKNLEECVTRFPEHYKSIYRLVAHYINSPCGTKSIEKARELLLGTYKTALGTQVAGLFTERKNNNFFNGIWRIPSSEVDRPGSFASHLSKCVIILMDVLKLNSDHEILIELATQLQRIPDNDKKYLNDMERKELFQQAISFCTVSYRNILKKHVEANDDTGILTLLIDIYKADRKFVKNMTQKESIFCGIMIEVYKAYVQDKAKIPESSNVYDLAIKLCTYEIANRKNQEKNNLLNQQALISGTDVPVTNAIAHPASAQKAIPYIPGLTKIKRTITKNMPVTTSTAATTVASVSSTTVSTVISTSTTSSPSSSSVTISKVTTSTTISAGASSAPIPTPTTTPTLPQPPLQNPYSDPKLKDSTMADYYNILMSAQPDTLLNALASSPMFAGLPQNFLSSIQQQQFDAKYLETLSASLLGLNKGALGKSPLFPGSSLTSMISSTIGPPKQSTLSPSNSSGKTKTTVIKDLIQPSRKPEQTPSTTITKVPLSEPPAKKPMLTLKKDLFPSTHLSSNTSNTLSSSSPSSSGGSKTKKSSQSFTGLEGIRDLPKSLTITPTMTSSKLPALPFPTGKGQHQAPKKAKSSKKTAKPFDPTPYSRYLQQPDVYNPLSKLSSAITVIPEKPKKPPAQPAVSAQANMQEYFSAYADMLRKYPSFEKTFMEQYGPTFTKNLLKHVNATTGVGAGPSQPKKQSKKSSSTSSSAVPNLSKNISSMYHVPISTPSPTALSKFNLQQQVPSQRSPSLSRSSPSSTKSFSPSAHIGRQSVTPPVSANSPAKTLQQKLAERKQANQARENAPQQQQQQKQAKKPPFDTDIIVLE